LILNLREFYKAPTTIEKLNGVSTSWGIEQQGAFVEGSIFVIDRL